MFGAIRFFKGRAWVIRASSVGGAAGAAVMYVNAFISHPEIVDSKAAAGFPASIAIGMIGGILGGVFASLIVGFRRHEAFIWNMGLALGVGLVNGFLTGTAAGGLIGLALSVLR